MDSENELLAEAKAGDTRAFEQALRPHLPMLFAYSRAICGDWHAAEDVVQETSQIAFKKLNYFIPEADFAAWLKAIARRQALSARRQLTRTPLIAGETIETVYQDPAPATEGARGEALAECLQKLGGRMARAVRAHYYEGLKLDEIAAALGMNCAALRQALHRVRLALLECVRRRLDTENAS